MTIVVDSSALLAMLLAEPRAEELELHLAESDSAVISAATYVEARIVVEAKLGAAGTQLFDQLLDEAGIEIVPLSPEAARAALVGWRRFGKGRHAAALNLGDCYAYGEARHRDTAILCVGEDFSQTDVATIP